MGGTELMYEELMRRLPQHHKDVFSIFNYPIQAETDKKLIYWNQLSYDQQSVQFLNTSSFVDQIDAFVFVSHWQAECYRKVYRIPGYKTQVIKNACISSYDRDFQSPIEKVKVCYTSTPWRGLDVLLNSWEEIKPDNCELHVFSSTKIYGEEFSSSNESIYEPLYERARSLPGVIYRGSINNNDLLNELPTFHILAYPCTFEETSCISVIEALSAGLRVITSNLGALPETTEGWARMYPYLANKEYHSRKFSKILVEEINKVKSGELSSQLKLQRDVYSTKWSWDERIKEWTSFLNILNPRSL